MNSCYLYCYSRNSLTTWRHLWKYLSITAALLIPIKHIYRNSVGFFGIAMKYEGNTPVELKKVAFVELSGPKMILNLCMVIGVIKMYSPWVPYYKIKILPFYLLLRHVTPMGTHHQGQESVIG